MQNLAHLFVYFYGFDGNTKLSPYIKFFLLVCIINFFLNCSSLCVEHVLDKRDTFVFEYLICVLLMYTLVFNIHYNCGSFEKSLIKMVL